MGLLCTDYNWLIIQNQQKHKLENHNYRHKKGNVKTQELKGKILNRELLMTAFKVIANR